VIVETLESRSVWILGYFNCDHRSGATCRLFISSADCGGLRRSRLGRRPVSQTPALIRQCDKARPPTGVADTGSDKAMQQALSCFSYAYVTLWCGTKKIAQSFKVIPCLHLTNGEGSDLITCECVVTCPTDERRVCQRAGSWALTPTIQVCVNDFRGRAESVGCHRAAMIRLSGFRCWSFGSDFVFRLWYFGSGISAQVDR